MQIVLATATLPAGAGTCHRSSQRPLPILLISPSSVMRAVRGRSDSGSRIESNPYEKANHTRLNQTHGTGQRSGLLINHNGLANDNNLAGTLGNGWWQPSGSLG